MLERPGGPEHLVVFISSDQNLDEKVQELQRRNFRVVVLYHEQTPNRKYPANIMNIADEAHDWLIYLQQELHMPHLTVSSHKAASHASGLPHGHSSTMNVPIRPAALPAVPASRSNVSKALSYQPGNQPYPPAPNVRPPAPSHRQGYASNGLQPLTAPNTASPSSNPRQPGMTAVSSNQHRNGHPDSLSRMLPDLLPEDSGSVSSRHHGVNPSAYMPTKPQPGMKAGGYAGSADAQVQPCVLACLHTL